MIMINNRLITRLMGIKGTLVRANKFKIKTYNIVTPKLMIIMNNPRKKEHNK